MVSILLNTMDRYDLTVRCIGKALATAEYPYEFLCCDNGSCDRRVWDYIEMLNIAYHRPNPTNEGCGQMHNQMLLRARGDFFCLLDNDIEIQQDGWLQTLVDIYEAIPESGVACVHTDWCGQRSEATTINGKSIHRAIPPESALGTRLFSRNVLEKVGYFCEDYGPYGWVDCDYSARVAFSGFLNYFIAGPSSLHLGTDSNELEYRRMKEQYAIQYQGVFARNMAQYQQKQNWYLPAPEIR